MNTFLLCTMMVLGATEAPSSDLEVTLGTGAGRMAQSVSGQEVDGFDLDAELSASWRWRWLAVGALTHADAAFNGTSGVSFGVSAGLAWRLNAGWRFDLDAVGGAHVINGLGSDTTIIGAGAHGYSATLPFLGFRGGVQKVFATESANHFTLGCTIFYDADLGSAAGTITHSDYCGLIGGCGGGTDQQVTARSNRLGAMITVGWAHDLGG
jgi:hypothetical protein